jgi:hypothetical protein
VLWLALASLAAVPLASANKPNFSGIWKLLEGDDPQIVIIDQNEIELRVLEFVEGRPSALRGPIDGQPHAETLEGNSCEFMARWEGDSLFLETKRGGHGSGGPVHVRYQLRLDSNNGIILAKRTNIAPRPGTVSERWERQNPPHPENIVTGFHARLRLDATGAVLSATDENRLQGLLGYAFNDVAQAEHGYLSIANEKKPSPFRDDARLNLSYTYSRNGLWGKAARVCMKSDRAFYKQLAKYPEMTVAHRGYAQLRPTYDPEGRILLPVTIAGKDANYMIDTGSTESLIRMSEARRLGLKLEHLSRGSSDGAVDWRNTLTVVPTLTVGATRFENVPFWVTPDDRLDWPGFAAVIGVDLLLKLETLRWDATGAMETGFPTQEKDIRKANLCFWNNSLFLEVSSSRFGPMVFFFDTGDNRTGLYPRFAMDNLDLVSASGELLQGESHGHGAHHKTPGLKLPDFPLRIGGLDVPLRPVMVILERSLLNECHGTLGIDVLNHAQRVTIDLHAMRLSLE